MLTKKQAVKLKRLIQDYAETMVADSWAGSADPEDYQSIRGSHAESAAYLREYIETLMEDAE